MKAGITYNTTYVPSTEVRVFLEGKRVGTIYNVHGEGWKYFPKGQLKGGEAFATLALCKQSLEAD